MPKSKREAEPPTGLYAMHLPEACKRLGFSLRTGNRVVAEGRFPIPHLPMCGVRRYRFSSADVDRYLQGAVDVGPSKPLRGSLRILPKPA